MVGADVMHESWFMLKRQEGFVQKAHPLCATRGLLNAAGIPIILATIPCLR